jgi:hypothetical protein
MRARHSQKSAAAVRVTERLDSPTARLNVPQDLTREHIFFNNMLRLSMVNPQRLPTLITLVIRTQKHTPAGTFSLEYRIRLSTFDLGA